VQRLRSRIHISGDVLALCAVIFLADVTSGVVSPTFSLFAQGMGISVAIIGVLTTIGGLTQMLTSVPLGVISDRLGRTRVIIGGLAAFTLSLLAMAAARGLPLLLLSRVLMGVAIVGTFQIGAAYLGDLTEPRDRPFAFGLYTTAMGSGFTVGPILGSLLAQHASTRLAYLVGAAVSLAAIGFAWRIHRRDTHAISTISRSAGVRNLRLILSQRDLMLVSFGNLLVNLTFAGAITTFFPLFAQKSAVTQATIGLMFAVRALVSTLGRLPNGIISRYLGNRAVMLVAIGLDVVVMFTVGHTSDPRWMTLLIALEGLAFGAYLVSGQSYVADRTAVENRGTAVGIYSTASSIGGTVGPLALGLAAGAWGLSSVFTVTAWTLTAGLLLSLAGAFAIRDAHPKSARTATSTAPTPTAEPHSSTADVGE